MINGFSVMYGGWHDRDSTTWSWGVGQSELAEHWHGDPWEYQPKTIELRDRDVPAKITCPRCRAVQILDAKALRLDSPPLKYRIEPR
jgi:hypothetical protein